MIKERIKSSVILLLIVNMLFLTHEIWFARGNSVFGTKLYESFQSTSFAERFFPRERDYSFPKENLSLPRKFLINDGSLWMAYYNTDIGFSPIEERTSAIIKGFLLGETKGEKTVDNKTWESGLESLSIYVEYPITFSSKMFCDVMGIDSENIKTQVQLIRDFIIIPSDGDTSVCLLVRDHSPEGSVYAYMMDDKYSFPADDLQVYTNSDDGYYEPAFSTALDVGNSNIKLNPLVLFSDSQPETDVIASNDLVNLTSSEHILENFAINPRTVSKYEDTDGAKNYIANYTSVKIYPDSIIEYTAESIEKGIVLDESGDAYNVLNASIDFAEKIWRSISDEPLNILVTNDLLDYEQNSEYTLKFNYYYRGRPVMVNISENYGHKKMNSALEMTVKNGCLVSYRQYLKSYSSIASKTLPNSFLTSLDYFVSIVPQEIPDSNSTINDIYIGYFDNGSKASIDASWIADIVSDGKNYYFEK